MPDDKIEDKKLTAAEQAQQVMLEASFDVFVVQIQELYPELAGDDKRKALKDMSKAAYGQAYRASRLVFARAVLKELANLFDPDAFLASLGPKAKATIIANPIDSVVGAAATIQGSAIETVVALANGDDLLATRTATMKRLEEEEAKKNGAEPVPVKTPTNVN